LLEPETHLCNPQSKDKKGSHNPLSRSSKEQRAAEKRVKQERVRGLSVRSDAERQDLTTLIPPDDDKISLTQFDNPAIGLNSLLSVTINGNVVEIKDQIQIYAANHLITHPLVSPVLQPTLGGLPPLFIQVGGGELLRDEQIYLAHKAAAPLSYLPAPSAHLSAEFISSQAARYRPTNVQLQVWDDLCHVAPTLSFTRPAKYMYRSIAQFGAWALARAQKTAIDILDDDDVSIISTTSSSGNEPDSNLSPDDIKISMPRSAQSVGFEHVSRQTSKGPTVGKAGDPLPPFEKHMIRQRIDRNGNINPLPPPTELEALKLSAFEIGVIKPGPVQKWMTAQRQWDEKFAQQKCAVQKKRIQDMERGFEGFDGETPPPTALAGRRVKGMEKEKAKKRSWGMSLWSLWGSKHDMITVSIYGFILLTNLRGSNAYNMVNIRAAGLTRHSTRLSEKRRQIRTQANQSTQPQPIQKVLQIPNPSQSLSQNPATVPPLLAPPALAFSPLTNPAHALAHGIAPSQTAAKPVPR